MTMLASADILGKHSGNIFGTFLLARRTLAGSLQWAMAPSVNGQIDNLFILPHLFFDKFEEGTCQQ